MALSNLLAGGVGIVTSVVTGNPAIGVAAASAVGSATGATKDAQGRVICPGTPSDDVVSAVLRNATDSQLRPVETHWNNSRGRELGIPLRQAPPREVSYWLMGNRDCRHSDPQGEVVQNIFATLASVYAPGTVIPAGQPQSTVDRVISTVRGEVEDTVRAGVEGAEIRRSTGFSPLALLAVAAVGVAIIVTK